MATHLNPCAYPGFSSRAAVQRRNLRNPLFVFPKGVPRLSEDLLRNCAVRISRTRAGGGESYLGMWRKTVERKRKSVEFERMAEASDQGNESDASDRQKELSVEDFDKKSSEIAEAKALLKDKLPKEFSVEVKVESSDDNVEDQPEDNSSSLPLAGGIGFGAPGPSFWIWLSPENDDDNLDGDKIQPAKQASQSPAPSTPVMEIDRRSNFLLLPFETSMLQDQTKLSIPPLQSLEEVHQKEVKSLWLETPHIEKEEEIGIEFSTNAAEVVDALNEVEEVSTKGVNPDGSRWWMETGIEQRPDGVKCKWTLTRGISADKAVEWENKYWEAADEFGYKELGSEKSGRDVMGNLWRECWRESMMLVQGLVHIEKTADKWGKNIQGYEWQEQWWEHYDSSCKAEKSAYKWCSIDPRTHVDVGHAHVWHERWGEEYDGKGRSMKYTDKWAERYEGDGWTKWGDKWDEHFGFDGHGMKQGETWWEGNYGERWNRTWGEVHNGSGWVHKYGKSSSGEHWDTHIRQDTLYDKFPHYGFHSCFENSVQLREVKKPSEWQELI